MKLETSCTTCIVTSRKLLAGETQASLIKHYTASRQKRKEDLAVGGGRDVPDANDHFGTIDSNECDICAELMRRGDQIMSDMEDSPPEPDTGSVARLEEQFQDIEAVVDSVYDKPSNASMGHGKGGTEGPASKPLASALPNIAGTAKCLPQKQQHSASTASPTVGNNDASQSELASTCVGPDNPRSAKSPLCSCVVFVRQRVARISAVKEAMKISTTRQLNLTVLPSVDYESSDPTLVKKMSHCCEVVGSRADILKFVAILEGDRVYAVYNRKFKVMHRKRADELNLPIMEALFMGVKKVVWPHGIHVESGDDNPSHLVGYIPGSGSREVIRIRGSITRAQLGEFRRLFPTESALITPGHYNPHAICRAISNYLNFTMTKIGENLKANVFVDVGGSNNTRGGEHNVAPTVTASDTGRSFPNNTCLVNGPNEFMLARGQCPFAPYREHTQDAIRTRCTCLIQHCRCIPQNLRVVFFARDSLYYMPPDVVAKWLSRYKPGTPIYATFHTFDPMKLKGQILGGEQVWKSDRYGCELCRELTTQGYIDYRHPVGQTPKKKNTREVSAHSRGNGNCVYLHNDPTFFTHNRAFLIKVNTLTGVHSAHKDAGTVVDANGHSTVGISCEVIVQKDKHFIVRIKLMNVGEICGMRTGPTCAIENPQISKTENNNSSGWTKLMEVKNQIVRALSSAPEFDNADLWGPVTGTAAVNDAMVDYVVRKTATNPPGDAKSLDAFIREAMRTLHAIANSAGIGHKARRVIILNSLAKGLEEGGATYKHVHNLLMDTFGDSWLFPGLGQQHASSMSAFRRPNTMKRFLGASVVALGITLTTVLSAVVWTDPTILLDRGFLPLLVDVVSVVCGSGFTSAKAVIASISEFYPVMMLIKTLQARIIGFRDTTLERHVSGPFNADFYSLLFGSSKSPVVGYGTGHAVRGEPVGLSFVQSGVIAPLVEEMLVYRSVQRGVGGIVTALIILYETFRNVKSRFFTNEINMGRMASTSSGVFFVSPATNSIIASLPSAAVHILCLKLHHSELHTLAWFLHFMYNTINTVRRNVKPVKNLPYFASEVNGPTSDVRAAIEAGGARLPPVQARLP